MLKSIRKNKVIYFLLFIIVLILLFLNHKIEITTLTLTIIIYFCFYFLFLYFLKKDRLEKLLVQLKNTNIRKVEKNLTVIEIALFKNDNFLIKIMYIYLIFQLVVITFFISLEDKSLNAEIFIINLINILSNDFFNIIGYITLLSIISIIIIFFDTKLLSEYRDKIENILVNEYQKIT